MLLLIAAIESEEDRSKATQIYEEYVGVMRRRAFEILRNRQDADDAVHDAFVRIIDHLDSLPDQGSIQTKWYVVTAAENAAIDIWRRRKRKQETTLDEEALEGNYRMPYEGENEIVRVILQKLSAKDRKLLLLKHVYGYKNAEVAQYMGMTEGAVKMAVLRAEERLEKECREEGLL